MKADLEAPVQTMFASTAGATSVNYASIGDTTGTYNPYYGYYWSWWEPWHEYHTHIHHEASKPNNFEVAFKIAKELLDKKLVKDCKTIRDFFALVDAIEGVVKKF